MIETERAERSAEPAEYPTEQPESVTQTPDPAAGQLESEVIEPDSLDKQTTWCNWTVLAMLVMCIFVITYFRPAGHIGAGRSSGIGCPLPELKLHPLVGAVRRVTLADLTGRVVLISFWQTGHSQSGEAPSHVAAIQRHFSDQSALKCFSVACGKRDAEDLKVMKDKARKLLDRQNIDMSVYADPKGISRAAVCEVMGSVGYPTTLVLDRLGRIRGVWSGFREGTEAEMRQLITQLLAEG